MTKPLVIDLKDPSYTPNHLLDVVSEKLKVANDHWLAVALDMAPPRLSLIRSRKAPVSALLLIDIQDRTGMSLKELRELMGVPFKGTIAEDMRCTGFNQTRLARSPRMVYSHYIPTGRTP